MSTTKPQNAARATVKFKADPTPPDHLSEPTRATWTQIVRDYGMHGDAAGLGLLETALTAWDRAEEARQTIAKEGLQVKDRYANWKPHPLLRVQAAFMHEYRSALKQLHLDVEPVRPGPGRPPGR
jgi:P27 family predicted phage terminase small subunit